MLNYKKTLCLIILIIINKVAIAQKAGQWQHYFHIDRMSLVKTENYFLASNNTLPFINHTQEKMCLGLKMYKSHTSVSLILVYNGFFAKDDIINTIELKFDNLPEEKVEFSQNSHNDKGIIYLKDPDLIIAKIRHSHKLLIRASINNESIQISEFNLKNFNNAPIINFN